MAAVPSVPEMSPPRSLRMHARACLITSRLPQILSSDPYFVYPDFCGPRKDGSPGVGHASVSVAALAQAGRVILTHPDGPLPEPPRACHTARRIPRHVARRRLAQQGGEVGRRVVRSGRAHCARTGARAYQHAAVCTRSRAGGRSPFDAPVSPR